MTPERMAALVEHWVRVYTRDLPAPLAERRAEELAADVRDHIASERARGTGERRIALGLLSRMLRGLAADAAWRRTAGRASTPSTRRSVVRVALVTACVLLVPGVAMASGAEVDWSVGDFVFAGTLLGGTGLLLELAVRRPRSVGYRVASAGVGVAAIVFGQADDAPGLVLFGCVVVVAGVVRVGIAARRRS